jgi:hypothetical protein
MSDQTSSPKSEEVGKSRKIGKNEHFHAGKQREDHAS